MAKFGDSGELLKCSFCGKSQKQVKKLIAGPGVYVCDECIDLCNEIIEEELSESTEISFDNLPSPREISEFLDEYVERQYLFHRELIFYFHQEVYVPQRQVNLANLIQNVFLKSMVFLNENILLVVRNFAYYAFQFAKYLHVYLEYLSVVIQ